MGCIPVRIDGVTEKSAVDVISQVARCHHTQVQLNEFGDVRIRAGCEFQAVNQGVELRYVGELAGIAEAALQVVRVAHRVVDESIDQRRGRNRLIFDLTSR
jgi:hypothetical protein